MLFHKHHLSIRLYTITWYNFVNANELKMNNGICCYYFCVRYLVMSMLYTYIHMYLNITLANHSFSHLHHYNPQKYTSMFI